MKGRTGDQDNFCPWIELFTQKSRIVYIYVIGRRGAVKLLKEGAEVVNGFITSFDLEVLYVTQSTCIAVFFFWRKNTKFFCSICY